MLDATDDEDVFTLKDEYLEDYLMVAAFNSSIMETPTIESATIVVDGNTLKNVIFALTIATITYEVEYEFVQWGGVSVSLPTLYTPPTK